jgi:cell fate (sporulation/competence/biofilm development) regulator YmcA (YheA/YmcA/DUF963 family)
MEKQSKQAYLDKVNARIKELGARLDQLKAKANQVDAETKIKFNQQIEKLLQKKQEMETRLDKIRTSSKGAWSNLKIGLDTAMSDLKTGIEKAIAEFKKK